MTNVNNESTYITAVITVITMVFAAVIVSLIIILFSLRNPSLLIEYVNDLKLVHTYDAGKVVRMDNCIMVDPVIKCTLITDDTILPSVTINRPDRKYIHVSDDIQRQYYYSERADAYRVYTCVRSSIHDNYDCGEIYDKCYINCIK